MDLFKHALFLGELDPPPFYVGVKREDPTNWLRMEIEVPRCSLPSSQAVLKVRPKQLYGVNRDTVASELLTSNALPGDRAHWERMFDSLAPADERDSVFPVLAAIPFRDFPARGRQELEWIIAPKVRLARWFREKGNSMPAFLADSVSPLRQAADRGSSLLREAHEP
jgi:hypothetical protein